MASTNDVIFLESRADFLTNPVDICFGSMPATSIAPTACLIIEGNAVISDRQIKTNLSKKTHPPIATRSLESIVSRTCPLTQSKSVSVSNALTPLERLLACATPLAWHHST
jgi:hypothetical protein